MSCEDIQPDLVAYLDHELAAERRQAVEGHLSACPTCGRMLEEFHRARELLAASPALETGPGFVQRILAASRERARGRLPARALRWLAPALAAGVLMLLLWPGRPAPEGGVDPADELEIASELELYTDYELIAELEVLSDLEAIESLEDEG